MREELLTTNTQAILIDMQTRLMPPMAHGPAVTSRTHFLLDALRELDIPVSITQQYTRGLGATLDILREAAPDAPVFEKITYSSLKDPAIFTHIRENSRKNILLFGVESHICVLQTALDLISEGYQVYLICDCTDSRSPYDREIAFRRLEKAGVILTTSESVIYEILKEAGTDIFRRISALVKTAPIFEEGDR